MAHITINELLNHKQIDLSLEIIGGHDGLENKIRTHFIQKSGLALTGYVAYVARNRVQIFGQTEISFFTSLDEDEQERVCKKFFDQRVACCLITRNLQVPEVLLHHAERTQTPVLRSQLPTQALIERLIKLLEIRFAKNTSLHGVLLDVFGVGVLLLGESGIGKSECALDLITRGHRLVADDTVDLVRQGPLAIYGRGPDVIKFHMEVRGLGIINIKELFGISSIRDRKKIQLVVKLVPWEKGTDYDRIGLDDKNFTILGVELPLIVLPVRPGRNLSTIVEVAARNHLLKLEGYHAAQEFQKHLLSTLAQETDAAAEEPE